MMFRGTLHLLCYRLVYHELLIEAGDVHDLAGLAGHIVCNYLLYLRVSGQFHMACGMLHLFGYQLPETHHHYLLATSFTDYWRRINIYWKDFMVRIFFNPVVFRLKRWPQPVALAVATATVFLATWLLHAYQLYWLQGSWGFTVPDALFWGILGVLVLVNVQLDARRSRHRRRLAAGASRLDRPRVGLRAAKVAGTFTTIAVLWSLWSSPSLSAWLDMLAEDSMDHDGMMSRQLLATLAILVCGLVPDRLAGGSPARLRAASPAACSTRPTPRGSSGATTSNCSTPGAASTTWAIFRPFAASAGAGNTFSAPVELGPAGHAGRRPARGGLEAVGLGPEGGHRSGAPTRRGCATGPIRSRRPPGTFRIALVGDSIGAGWGVNVEQRFESILERDWDARSRDGRAARRSRSSTAPCRVIRPASVGTTSSRSAGRCGPTW